jgi:hypothetical protein
MRSLTAREKVHSLLQQLDALIKRDVHNVQLLIEVLILLLEGRNLLLVVRLERVELPDGELELLLMRLSCLLPPLGLQIGLDLGLQQLELALLLGLRLPSEPVLQDLQLGLHAGCLGEEGHILCRGRIRLPFDDPGFLLLELAVLPFQLVVLQPEHLLALILLRELLLHALMLPAFDLNESSFSVLVPFIVQFV